MLPSTCCLIFLSIYWLQKRIVDGIVEFSEIRYSTPRWPLTQHLAYTVAAYICEPYIPALSLVLFCLPCSTLLISVCKNSLEALVLGERANAFAGRLGLSPGNIVKASITPPLWAKRLAPLCPSAITSERLVSATLFEAGALLFAAYAWHTHLALFMALIYVLHSFTDSFSIARPIEAEQLCWTAGARLLFNSLLAFVTLVSALCQLSDTAQSSWNTFSILLLLTFLLVVVGQLEHQFVLIPDGQRSRLVGIEPNLLSKYYVSLYSHGLYYYEWAFASMLIAVYMLSIDWGTFIAGFQVYVMALFLPFGLL